MTTPFSTPIQTILPFGNPALYQQSDAVQANDHNLPAQIEQMFQVLADFQQKNGWGRAVAAPQLGIHKRMIAVNLGEGPFIMINPDITYASEEKFVVWDDCMSMPTLLVEVERHLSIDVDYLNGDFEPQQFAQCTPDLSELLQHEIDHLNGVVMTDRVIDVGSIIHRSEKARFEQLRLKQNRGAQRT